MQQGTERIEAGRDTTTWPTPRSRMRDRRSGDLELRSA